MTDQAPNINELSTCERALRKVGSNLWFGGLSNEWQDFLVSHTVECFDMYEVSMLHAAQMIINIFQQMLLHEPDAIQESP